MPKVTGKNKSLPKVDDAVDSSRRFLIVPLFRGSSRFESLILSHHSRFTCECNREEIDDDDDDDFEVFFLFDQYGFDQYAEFDHYGVDQYAERSEPSIWICKPSDSSRGRGIFLISDMSQLIYDQQVRFRVRICFSCGRVYPVLCWTHPL